eukprot:scaffold3961_cov222-Pinguiococcus_pyrenoidosus.AAC.3
MPAGSSPDWRLCCRKRPEREALPTICLAAVVWICSHHVVVCLDELLFESLPPAFALTTGLEAAEEGTERGAVSALLRQVRDRDGVEMCEGFVEHVVLHGQVLGGSDVNGKAWQLSEAFDLSLRHGPSRAVDPLVDALPPLHLPLIECRILRSLVSASWGRGYPRLERALLVQAAAPLVPNDFAHPVPLVSSFDRVGVEPTKHRSSLGSSTISRRRENRLEGMLLLEAPLLPLDELLAGVAGISLPRPRRVPLALPRVQVSAASSTGRSRQVPGHVGIQPKLLLLVKDAPIMPSAALGRVVAQPLVDGSGLSSSAVVVTSIAASGVDSPRERRDLGPTAHLLLMLLGVPGLLLELLQLRQRVQALVHLHRRRNLRQVQRAM